MCFKFVDKSFSLRLWNYVSSKISIPVLLIVFVGNNRKATLHGWKTLFCPHWPNPLYFWVIDRQPLVEKPENVSQNHTSSRLSPQQTFLHKLGEVYTKCENRSINVNIEIIRWALTFQDYSDDQLIEYAKLLMRHCHPQSQKLVILFLSHKLNFPVHHAQNLDPKLEVTPLFHNAVEW